MVNFNKKCRVCAAIKADPKLEKRIENSTWYIKGGTEDLQAIQRDNIDNFSYDSILRHTKNHQSLTPAEIKRKNQTLIARNARRAAKYERAKAGDVWDKVIAMGLQKLDAGELEMKTADLLKATKDKSDFELKVKDQELALAEMVAYFASGEGNQEESKKYDRRIIEGEAAEYFDPAEQLAADSERRANESRAFYQRVVGDAAAPGTD